MAMFLLANGGGALILEGTERIRISMFRRERNSLGERICLEPEALADFRARNRLAPQAQVLR